MKAISEKMTPRIKSQQEAHRQRDETMVLDLRESIDVYEETHRELMAMIAQVGVTKNSKFMHQSWFDILQYCLLWSSFILIFCLYFKICLLV